MVFSFVNKFLFKDKCIKEVKKVETDNLKDGKNDTVYNFLLGGKGNENILEL